MFSSFDPKIPNHVVLTVPPGSSLLQLGQINASSAAYTLREPPSVS